MAGDRNAILVVTVHIDPENDDEFNRWFDEEHIPEKLGEPGFVSARRFRSPDDPTHHLVIYELDDPDAADRSAQSGRELTPWSKKIITFWKDSTRAVWVQIA